MATFRTDPDTGRTVISEANRVDRPISDFSSSDAARTVNRFDDDLRSGGFGPPVAGLDTGTGYMTRQEFETVSGMTDTNPYGRDGFFSRVFGIDPSKIDYTNNLGPQGIENVKRQAYDRFLNPFARVDAFDRPTMGASFAQGTTRSGVQPGDLTIFGPAAEGRAEGIGALIGNALGFNMNPTIIPGTVGSDARSQDRGIYNFEIPENMDQLVSAALRENAIEARDPAAVPEVVDREIFTTDDDSPSGAVDYDTVSQFAPAESTYDLESRLDRRRAVPQTVAEALAAAPLATGSVLVNPRPTVTTPETENQRIMREQQEAFDAALRRRQQESAAFVDRTNETLDEILRKGDTIVTPGVRGGAIEPLASDLLNPQNIREVLQLAGRDSTRPFPIEIIPESLLAGSR